MVGFVLIMLVVAVMFLVFLGIYLRGAAKTHETEGKDIASFLESVSKFTIECDYSGDPSDLSDLIIKCSDHPTNDCYNGKNVCDILRDTLNKAINSTWNFNENSPTKAYFMQLLRETSAGEEPLRDGGGRPIQPAGGGIQTNNIRAAEKPFPNGIIMRLEIYY